MTFLISEVVKSTCCIVVVPRNIFKSNYRSNYPAEMGKVKKEKQDKEAEVDVSIKTEDDYDEKLAFVSPIAKPMASKKIAKKCFKLIKKAAKQKNFIRNGLKDVQKRLRKGERGIVIFAGDVSPVEMICHLPAVCEEKSIPYVYVPSKADLGAAMGVKRASVTILIREHEDYKELFDECKQDLSALPIPV